MANPLAATAKQIAAFKKVEKAIKEAQKTGLYFYGRQNMLAAITDKCFKYLHANGGASLIQSRHKQVPVITSRLLADSGADDYEGYASEEDEEYYENQ